MHPTNIQSPDKESSKIYLRSSDELSSETLLKMKYRSSWCMRT